jgi:hypothetical protein
MELICAKVMYMNWENRKNLLVKIICFCIDGLLKGGLKEAKSRLSSSIDLSLHKLIGSRYKKTVEKYFNDVGITPVGGLMSDLSLPNRRALIYFAYAVKHFSHIIGVRELLAELANVDREPDEENTHNGERRYHNCLVELHGCYFVHRCLGMEIEDVEYNGHTVISPGRSGNRSCDIKGHKNGIGYYFECKDSSWEIVHREPFYDSYITTPKTYTGCKAWLEERMLAADEKGADFLLAKIPIWSRYKGNKRNCEWMLKVFPESHNQGGKQFLLKGSAGTYKNLKGAYILLRRSALELIL